MEYKSYYTIILYEEFDLFSTSGSKEEARGESDRELVIRKPKADVKSTKKGTNHRMSSHDGSPESLSASLQSHKRL